MSAVYPVGGGGGGGTSDVTDRVGRLLGIVASITAAVDISDRVARLIGAAVIRGGTSGTNADVLSAGPASDTGQPALAVRVISQLGGPATTADISDRVGRLVGRVSISDNAGVDITPGAFTPTGRARRVWPVDSVDKSVRLSTSTTTGLGINFKTVTLIAETAAQRAEMVRARWASVYIYQGASGQGITNLSIVCKNALGAAAWQTPDINIRGGPSAAATLLTTSQADYFQFPIVAGGADSFDIGISWAGNTTADVELDVVVDLHPDQGIATGAHARRISRTLQSVNDESTMFVLGARSVGVSLSIASGTVTAEYQVDPTDSGLAWMQAYARRSGTTALLTALTVDGRYEILLPLGATNVRIRMTVAGSIGVLFSRSDADGTNMLTAPLDKVNGTGNDFGYRSLAAVANAAAPAWTEAKYTPLSVDLVGNLRVALGAAVDVSDRAGRLLGIVDKGKIWDGTNIATVKAGVIAVVGDNPLVVTVHPSSAATATQPVSMATNTPDVTDRAVRLLGVVYGSQAQQLKQTATNFNLAVETYVAAVAIDPRDVSDRVGRALGVVASITAAVDVSDRAGRALGAVSPAAASVWDVSDRAGRALGVVASITAAVTVNGDVDHNAVNTLKNIQVAGNASPVDLPPTAVGATGNRVREWMDRFGSPVIRRRKVRESYTAIARLAEAAARLDQTFTQVANTNKQWSTLHHAATATKELTLERCWVYITSDTVAGIQGVIELRELSVTTLPATGNPAITPRAHRIGTGAAEATCLYLPTTQGSEAAVNSPLGHVPFDTGISGTTSVANPVPILVPVVLFDGNTEDDEMIAPTAPVGVYGGWAVMVRTVGAPVLRVTVVWKFREEIP